MCGITGGVWTTADKAIPAEVLARMTEILRHRGPDDAGQYHSQLRCRQATENEPGVALGFRRLSIIDLELAGQPLSNEDATVWVVFNGEIYNYPDLRARLESKGHVFRTRGDGETIVHLYEEEGVDCFTHLNGMFAIAIWDARRQQLVLGRDRLGQKPLVYRHEPGRLLFASELKSILQVPGVPRAIDPVAVDHYLTYQYVPHPRTIFLGTEKLAPGHFAVYRDNQLTVQRYWDADFNQQWEGSLEEGVEELQRTLQSAVELRMQSDVPLGAFLSGGVDSSLIVALMQKAATRRIDTFSIGFSVREYDETRFARQVAEHLGTNHHEFQVTPRGIDILPKLVWHYDEPFADSSAIPTWYVSELTRKHVTVSLTGDGGDELFMGYPRYGAIALAQWLDRLGPARHLFASPLWQKLPASPRQKSKLRQFKRFCEALGASPLERYLDWVGIFNGSRRQALYRADVAAELGNEPPIAFLRSAMLRSSKRDLLTSISLTDLQTYLPGDLMTKVDIASMGHALECRQPFLDVRLVELAAGFPRKWKFRRGVGKRMLQRAFGSLLPDTIWSRPKMGFGVPLDHWFRDELRDVTHDLLLGEGARTGSFFERSSVAELARQHEQGEFDHAQRLWALLILEAWMQQWCDSAI